MTLKVVELPRPQIAQEDIEALEAIENRIRLLRAERDRIAGDILHRLKTGLEVEPGPYGLRIVERRRAGAKTTRLLIE